MDTIPKYLATSALMGPAVGVAFGVALLATDTLGLQSLIAVSADVAGVTAIFLLGCAVTFAPLVISTALGLLRDAHH